MAEPDERPPRVIEQTAKRYKAMQLFCGLLLAVALALILPVASDVAAGDTLNTRFAIGLAISVCGATALIAGKILAWWHHG